MYSIKARILNIDGDYMRFMKSNSGLKSTQM